MKKRLPPEAGPLLKAAARSARGPLFLVGGALRDALLGRETHDLDLACAEDPAPLSRRLARELGGTAVALDEAGGVHRVALRPGGEVRQLDLARVQGRGIEEDLARRDFTVNALALPVGPGGAAPLEAGRLIDPRGGLADLKARRLRAESEQPFRDDPLRLLRAFRFAAQLGFEIEAKTLAAVARLRHLILKPAGERVQAELMQMLGVPGASRELARMDAAGLLTALFEDLEPARRCATVYYGDGGVLKHSLETAARADFLLARLPRVFPRHARAVRAELARRSKPGAPFEALLVLAALLHDVSKAETARMVDGRLRFFGHDSAGARRAGAILKRLRFSRDAIDCVAAVVGNHLRPGNLAASGEVTDKAAYRFFRDLGPEALPLLLVCWADHASYLPEARLSRSLAAARLAPDRDGKSLARLPEAERKTVFHLQVVHHLLSRLLDAEKAAVPERLLDGNAVMKALGLKPGPEVGRCLELLREAQAEGKVGTRDEALLFLKRTATNR